MDRCLIDWVLVDRAIPRMSWSIWKVLGAFAIEQRRVGVGCFFRMKREDVCAKLEMDLSTYKRCVRLLEAGSLIARVPEKRAWLMRPRVLYADMSKKWAHDLEEAFESEMEKKLSILRKLAEKDALIGESAIVSRGFRRVTLKRHKRWGGR